MRGKLVRTGRAHAWLFAVILAVLVGASCTEETIIFRDREAFNPPPDAAAGYLGYYNVGDKQTTCGNCHTGVQSDWENTAHASAWEGLQSSGGAQDFCEGCHTVSELGNLVDTTAGYNAVADSAYHDVQCESCHGPGLAHVENTDGVKPLASIVVDTALANGCGECHSDTHHPFVEQWKESAHGSGGSFSRGGSATCAPCHNPRVTMEVAFGAAGTVFAEQDTLAVFPAVYCAVCHDPHGSPYDAQLRAPIDVATQDHLCVACHSRSATPRPGSYRGAHGAQGPLVIGEAAGWIPPGFAYDTTLIASSHGTEANPKLCATCHVPSFEVTDEATGDFLLGSVGHLFEAVVCLDAEGLPTEGPCADADRYLGACVGSGCHNNEASTLTAFQSLKTRINTLVDILWTDTDGDAAMDATDGGLLPRLVAADDTLSLWIRDDSITTAEGALFNAQLAYTHDREHWGGGTIWGESFSTHKASGEGVHNPFLLEALLTASIQAVLNTYPGPPPSAELLEALRPQFRRPANVRFR